MSRLNLTSCLLVLAACAPGAESPPSAPVEQEVAAAAPTPSAAPEPAKRFTPESKGTPATVVDIALSSPDHTTLVAALKAADLVGSLDSPGGAYTVFAPTNAAFGKLPPGTVEGLLKPENLSKLKAILQHHAMVPILQIRDLKDGQQLGMADGTKVTVHVQDGKVKIGDANVLATVSAANGVVHVVDAVILPGS
jgi:uncharacterized surface protein with fasciclin (FAS1) repeats